MFSWSSMWFVAIVACVFFISTTEAQSGNSTGVSVMLTEAASKYGAVCLDGTPGNYYFARGTQSKKYVMFLQGGGWCYNDDQCWTRATTASTGSTKNDAKTVNMNKVGMLGNDAQLSPLFYDWNKIYVRYCDGGSYSGDVTDPVVIDNNASQIVYYRGKRILNGVFNSLIADYSLATATDFVLSGGSAGGLGAFLHTNYVADNFFDLTVTKFVSMPDVGFFIEYNGWQGKTQWAAHMQNVFVMQNVTSSIIDPTCFADTTLMPSDCFFAQNMARDNIVPTFVLNSQYDQFQASSILGTGTSNATLLNEYGQNFTRILINNFLSRNTKIFGAFIDGCYHHAAQNPIYWTSLNISGYTQATAFTQFYNGLGKDGNQVFWYQNVSYPCVECCPNSEDYVDQIQAEDALWWL